MTTVSRGEFTKGALAAGSVFAASGASAWARPAGANGDIRVAIVGVRKKGVEHIKAFGEIPGVRIVALCDVDRVFLDREIKLLAGAGKKVEGFADYRKLLEMPDLDAVVLSVPDHWHGLMTVWACQAGKDIYVEKPLSHNIWEGRVMVEAVHKYKRIVQVGSQNRSDTGLRPAAAYIRKGELGRIKLVRAISYGYREGIGKVDGPQPIPSTVDYDLFVGPAPMQPLMRQNLHYDWHWFWDTGTGEMGNLGAHNVDESRWFMGMDAPAPRVVSLGGRLGFYDDGETANTQITLFGYRPVPLIYEIRNLPRRQPGQEPGDDRRWPRRRVGL